MRCRRRAARCGGVRAVVAESYSDYKTAKEKFQEVLKLAPKDSLYFERAKRKLNRYVQMRDEGSP